MINAPHEETVIVELDCSGDVAVKMLIAVLPGTPANPCPLIDLRSQPTFDDEAVEPIQLLESTEYRYELRTSIPFQRAVLHPRELFAPDSVRGNVGRLRPGLHTGLLSIRVELDGAEAGRVGLEVRSRKLDYVNQYRWMLRDLATAAAEIVMARFAAAEQLFSPDNTRDASTLYQRFAFLQAALGNELFDVSIRQILVRPYVSWDTKEESSHPGKGARISSALIRSLTRPGRRVSSTTGPLPSLPAVIPLQRTEATVDNVPNRFVKFVVLRWRGVVADIAEILRSSGGSFAAERGAVECGALLERLDALLSEELFREVGELAHFPGGNQVLQKRAGYRDVFQVYIESEVAARLAWRGGEDVYGAGQKNVATLYEYWAFLQVARIVAELCTGDFDWGQVIEVDSNSLSIDLRRGRAKVLSGTALRLGRRLAVELWFNRPFSRKEEGVWTLPMRPDLSLLIRPADSERAGFDPIWVHFDAKYRIERLGDLFDADSQASHSDVPMPAPTGEGRALRNDVLKMHAYRDAIRRSAGAYVIYPGSDNKEFRAFHELLPGLGAFALQPARTGEAVGSAGIRKFLDDVLLHVASQATQHERGRYWMRRVFEEPPVAINQRLNPAPFLEQPPADTVVLLGYVRGLAHLEWIHRHGLYNVRADARSGRVEVGSRALAAEVVILFGRGLEGGVELWRTSGQPRVFSRKQMQRLGYPGAKGISYFCFSLQPLEDDLTPGWLTPQVVARALRTYGSVTSGAPTAISWADLVASHEDSSQQ